PAVLECLAEQIQTSHKDQLQVLSRILESPPVTLGAARSAISEFLNQWSQGLSYSDIVRITALSFGVRVSEIYAAGRSRVTADARHACFYLARKLLGEPYERIGDHFGGRDHATVLQACQRMERGRGPLRDRLRRLERTLVER
ncbi:MAG TPA: helix-turn-helix domain-containing protein, partial [Planctomycetota bacterium]|nr:helix-turn-helix domain-containing protein [Planctomycetota bacterium]